MAIRRVNDYIASLTKARFRAQDKLLKEQEQEITRIYDRAFREAYSDLLKSEDLGNSFTGRAAKAAYVNQLYEQLTEITNKYNTKISSLSTMMSKDFFNYTLPDYKDTKLFQEIDKNVKKATQQSVETLIKGEIYKDGKGLSSRLWTAVNNSGDKIELAIQSCVARGLSSMETAEILSEFGTGGHRTWDRKKIKEKLGSGYARKYRGGVDYEALRLARTTTTHLGQLSVLNNEKVNPYSQGVKWKSVHAANRTCELCKERDGKIYLNKDCPMDHPNGMCHLEPIFMIDGKEVTPEEMSKDLANWIKGKPNSGTMDKLYGDVPIEKPKKSKKPTGSGKKSSINNTKVTNQKAPTVVQTGQLFTPEERKQKYKELEDKWVQMMKTCTGNTRGINKHPKNIVKALKNFPLEIQDLYLYSLKDLKLGHTNSGAYFMPSDKKIYISLQKCEKDKRGAYTVVFHEWGHMIDDGLGVYTKNKSLYKYLEEDLNDIVDAKAGGILERETAYNLLSRDLESAHDAIHGVSDIYGGLTKQKVSGWWGHKESYWNRGDREAEVCSEAWADILQSYSNKKETEYISKYLPKSRKFLEEQVKQINEDIKSGKIKWRA